MIKARHHFLLYPFFRFYVIRKMKRSFNSFNIVQPVEDKGLPVLLVCNHVSWWDGIWAFQVNRLIFKRKFYFMMLEEQLRKHWFFKYTGGFPVARNSKQVVESLQYTSGLLEDKRNLVLFFPQGQIESMHRHQVVFHKGIEKITQGVKRDLQLVFLVCLVDYFSGVKPEVNAYLHQYTGKYSTAAIQDEYNNFYSRCIAHQLQIKG